MDDDLVLNKILKTFSRMIKISAAQHVSKKFAFFNQMQKSCSVTSEVNLCLVSSSKVRKNIFCS